MNYFELLEIPAAAIIDLDQLKQNFQTKAGENHPDQGGNEKVFKDINEANNTLRFTHSRLKHLLETAGAEFNPRGAVTEEVMDFFMPIGELIQTIEAHLSELESASSALQKAMLTPKTMELQETVEKYIDQLDRQETKIEDSLKSVDSTNLTSQLDLVTVSARDLTFITKWKAQLREKYAKLWV